MGHPVYLIILLITYKNIYQNLHLYQVNYKLTTLEAKNLFFSLQPAI